MPEGHTLHRLAAAYRERFADRITSSSSPQGRFEAEAAKLDGRVLTDAQAYGKHLFCAFGELTVHVHLGLLGKITFTDGPPPPPVGALRWRLTTPPAVEPSELSEPSALSTEPPTVRPAATADLRGPTACHLVTPPEIDALQDRIGPDPLRAPDDERADPDRGWRRVRSSRTPIAVLLMDQRVLAGVGNIYRAEVLFRHRLDPMMEGRLLRPAEWRAIWADLVDLMRYGVDTGRIDTVRPEHEPEAMGRAAREDRHGGEVYVYRRAGQPCLVCGQPVRAVELAGRNLFWCPGCQRRTRRRVPNAPAPRTVRPRARRPSAAPSAAAPSAAATPRGATPAPGNPGSEGWDS